MFLAHGTELLSVFHLPFMCVGESDGERERERERGRERDTCPSCADAHAPPRGVYYFAPVPPCPLLATVRLPPAVPQSPSSRRCIAAHRPLPPDSRASSTDSRAAAAAAAAAGRGPSRRVPSTRPGAMGEGAVYGRERARARVRVRLGEVVGGVGWVRGVGSGSSKVTVAAVRSRFQQQ